MKKVLLVATLLITAAGMGFSQCTTTNATNCSCSQSGVTNCDLLPDMIVGKPPLLTTGNYGVIEYSQSGNGSNNAKLRLSVSTPNIGFGPLEVRTTTTYVCGTDTFTGTAPSICPDGVTYPRQLINQRVYHKNGNTMTYYDRPGGTMTYHPAHGHMHVDDWGKYTLRTATANPDPLTWPIVASGAKLAFCLMDYGTCSYYNGHCVDSAGNTLTNSNFPNYGLGGGSYNCSPVVQGISSGYTDIYYQYLDGMWINLPPGLCNGPYYIVVQLDPYNYFLESNENNNVLAVPFTLTQQTALPTITSSPNATICSGTSTTMTASGASTYSWAPATGLNATTGGSVSASPAANTVYTVTGTSAAGCTKTKTVSITVNAKPTLTLTPATAVCTGQSAPLMVSGATSYTWSPSTGLSGTTGSSVTASPASTTTYTVTATGSNGCTNTGTVMVTVNPLPSVTVSPAAVICSGSSANLAAGGAASYAWSPATGLNVTSGAAVVASPLATTTYTVTGTTNNCSSISTVTVTVNPLPPVSVSASSVICSGQTAVLSAGGAATYSWSPATGLNNSTGASVNATPSSTTTYTVAGTGGNGCTATAQTTVTVIQTPQLSLSPDAAFCTGGTAQLTASGAAEYVWTPPAGLDTAAGNTVHASPASTTVYTVIGSNGSCTDTGNITVTVNAIPSVSFTGLSGTCFVSDPDMALTGIPAGGTFSGSGISGNTFSPAAAGVGGPYIITYALTDANGCSASYSESVLVSQQATSCGIPTPYPATDISPFSATINWAPDVTAPQFRVRYRPVGTITYKSKTVSGSPGVTSAVLNNLLPNTYYECWVKCVCAAPTTFSSVINFTTGSYPYTCTVPVGQQTTNITTTTATVSWDPSASGDSVKVKYTKAGVTPVYKYKKSSTNTSFINLINLKAGTTYNWWVQVYCNGVARGNSTMSSFTTATIRLENETDQDENRVLAYPNPVNDRLHVVFKNESKGNGRVWMTDPTGRAVFSRNLRLVSDENLIEIDVHGFAKGMYLLGIDRNDNHQFIKVIVN